MEAKQYIAGRSFAIKALLAVMSVLVESAI
jgi:hypothetical protein